MTRPRTAATYAARIDRVLDHVRAHLDGDLGLDRLARVAHFSPYHFHRIFKAVTGETLNAFVRRTRVERAGALLRSSPERTVSSVAHECGFSSLASLSRAFTEQFGVRPSKWDRKSRLQVRKIRQAGPEYPAYTSSELAEMESLFAGLAPGRVFAMSHDDPDITPRERSAEPCMMIIHAMNHQQRRPVLSE